MPHNADHGQPPDGTRIPRSSGTLTGAFVACGGDDGDGGTTPDVPDTGTFSTVDASSSDASATQAVAASITIYYGATAKLDGAASTGPGLTYTWAVASGPPGTAVTALDGASTATPSFTPDKVGIYNLTLQVAGGGATSTIPVTVTVVDPPVFYANSDFDGGTHSASFNVVGAAFGDGGTPVSCFARDSGSDYSSDLSFVGQIDSDSWEGQPDQPARLVYSFDTTNDGGVPNTTLLASTSASTCATAPTALDQIGNGSPGSRSIEQPKFSPSGNRVAYVRSTPAGATLSTVGFDGSARRDLAPYYAYPDGGPAASTATTGSMTTLRPDWINETTVAWVQQYGSNWHVMQVADAPGASPTVLMTCPGTGTEGLASTVRQFALLANGDVVVSQTGTDGTAGVYVYTPDAATKNCGARRELTKVAAASGGSSTAFTVSPDRTRIGVVLVPDASAAREIRVLGLDGAVLGVVPGALQGYGPRWVGQGAFLTWPAAQNGLRPDAATGAAVIAVAQADGGGVHQLTAPPVGSQNVVAIGTGFCAMGRAFGPGVTLFGVLGVAGLALARRRKRA